MVSWHRQTSPSRIQTSPLSLRTRCLGWLVGWLVVFVGWWVGGLVGWLVSWLVGWLVGLVGWCAAVLTDC